MKKILITTIAAVGLLAIGYLAFFNRNTPECEGLYCDFLSQIEKEFELTGGEKDQGYLFLRDHSEQDTTTNRVIIRSIDGVYFAYPAEGGWYAQQKGADEKITLNELGHALAEKEIEYEAKIEELLDTKLKAFKEDIKRQYSWRKDELSKQGIPLVDTAIFNNVKIDTSFLADELKTLRRGEMPFYDFTSIVNGSDELFRGYTGVYGERPKVGFYNNKQEFYPITGWTFSIDEMELTDAKLNELSYGKRVEYLITNKIVETSLIERSSYDRSLNFSYECSPLIYVPTEKKWYGPDKLKEVLKKYGLM